MVQIVYKDYPKLRAIRTFFVGVFAFIGFVVLLHALIIVVAGCFAIFAIFTGMYLSTIIGPAFNSL